MIGGKLNPNTLDAMRLFHAGAEALAEMEHAGIRVDLGYLTRKDAELEGRIKEAEAAIKDSEVWEKWKRRYGTNSNLHSRAQLAEVLFNVLGFDRPQVDKTAGGKDKTDEEVLLKLDDEWCREYLRLQKLKKASGTYLRGIRAEVVDGFLRPVFDLHLTVTYRSSSSMPNFQNIPIRNHDVMQMIRGAFVPRPGRRLVEVDFSGIEVRIAACYNKDPVLIKYIEDPSTDMHRDTAADLFLFDKEFLAGEGKDWAKATVRDFAKNRFVFPQFYGSVWSQCAPHLWEGVQESTRKVPGTDKTLAQVLAKKGIRKLGKCEPRQDPQPGTFGALVQEAERAMWKDRFKVYAEWKYQWWDEYQRRGYFHTYTGFTVASPLKRNEAINNPIQGSAFHCLLWCIVEISKILRKRKMKSVLVGQIHDSLIGDVMDGELDEFLAICKKVMTVLLPKAFSWICVPIAIEADVTPVDAPWSAKVAHKF